MKKSEIFFGVLRLPVDFATTFSAFLLAYYLRPITDLIPGVQYTFEPGLLPVFSEYLPFALVATSALILIMIFGNLYSLKIQQRFWKEWLRIGVAVTAWMLLIIAYYFLVVHQLFFSRIALAHIWILSFLLIGIGRFMVRGVQRFLLRFGIGQRKILIVGASEVAEHFYQGIKNDPIYQVIGALDVRQESRKNGNLKIIGTLEDLPQVAKKYGIEEIIQADETLKTTEGQDILSYCQQHQIVYHFIPDLARLQQSNVEISTVSSMPLITLKQTPLDGWGRVIKRLFDILFSLVFILLLIPIWILVSLLVKLTSRGPMIYKSRRQYRDTIFHVYKFRSMVENAEALKKELLEKNEREGPLFKIKKDPRVTGLGRFLRKTSIDELPQLFNVLKGEMSLVGPRPHLPEEVKNYDRHHYRVFAIKPGITGLAQISGRSNLNFEDEVKLDVYYIENWSLWMDIKLIIKSVLVVLKANGH